MLREGPELADVFRRFGPAFRDRNGMSLSSVRRHAMAAIENCRTATLGGHVERCGECGDIRVSYNSCRNRNCPKCQGLARAQWITDRHSELLDVPYFHVVFTLPHEIAVIAFQNQTVVYDILFSAVAETLRKIAADPEHLGAEIGFLAVLHTWGQNLMHHPHLHCLVPGGGIAPDGESWIACRPGFFLPVRVLSRLFRGLFLHRLEQAFAAGRLRFFDAYAPLREPAAFRRYLAPLWPAEWVVYAKRPFAGPEQVLNYVGRYTHRVAIANNRILSVDETRVRFHWKDYRDGDRRKTMSLSGEEFLRRFLIHVLPSGFRRIRYFGFLANPHRAAKLTLCRRLLGTVAAWTADHTAAGNPERTASWDARVCRACPRCGIGFMTTIASVTRFLGRETGPDTS
jgi:hypothetical protein